MKIVTTHLKAIMKVVLFQKTNPAICMLFDAHIAGLVFYRTLPSTLLLFFITKKLFDTQQKNASFQEE